MRVIGVFSPGEGSSTVAPTMSSWVRSTPPGPRFSLLRSAIRLLSWISCGPPGGGLLPWVLESPRTSSWWDAQSDLAMSSSSVCLSWKNFSHLSFLLLSLFLLVSLFFSPSPSSFWGVAFFFSLIRPPSPAFSLGPAGGSVLFTSCLSSFETSISRTSASRSWAVIFLT